jgi:ribosomal protein S20
MTKICTKCNTEKPLNSFAKDKNGKYSVKSKCKTCIKEYRSVYNADNQDKIKEYFTNNKDRLSELNKKYYYGNHEFLKNKHKQYGKDNPEVRRKATAKYLKNNPEYYNQYRRNRYNTDPQFKLRIVLGNRLNEVLKKSKTNKTSNIIVLLGCSLDEVKQHIEKQFTELMFWENHGIYWEVDHIIPCDKFDLTDIEQQKQCFHYSNLQPLIKTENRQKSNK